VKRCARREGSLQWIILCQEASVAVREMSCAGTSAGCHLPNGSLWCGWIFAQSEIISQLAEYLDDTECYLPSTWISARWVHICHVGGHLPGDWHLPTSRWRLAG
jgi:hypothetical protein